MASTGGQKSILIKKLFTEPTIVVQMSTLFPQKGFTLIELMIAIAILAIVTTIAVPAYTGYVKTAQNTEGWNNLHSLQLALEEYYIENGTYVSTMEDSHSSAALNWRAKPDAGGTHHFTYSIAACGSGSINTCYTITATRTSDSSTLTLSGP